jgi:hypothetical protein
MAKVFSGPMLALTHIIMSVPSLCLSRNGEISMALSLASPIASPNPSAPSLLPLLAKVSAWAFFFNHDPGSFLLDLLIRDFLIAMGAFHSVYPGSFENYRAHSVFERLTKWLRKKGVNSRKPIHELRKEFGSMVNRKHGLSAAKDLLRHPDISITASHYIDSPRQATRSRRTLRDQA